MGAKDIMRALFIDVKRSGPRVNCPKCYNGANFSYSFTATILPVIWMFLVGKFVSEWFISATLIGYLVITLIYGIVAPLEKQ
jgi:hypothetical protein